MLTAGGLDPIVDDAMARFAVTGDWSDFDLAIERARALRVAATPGRRVIVELGLTALLLSRAQQESTGAQTRLDEAVAIASKLRAGPPLPPAEELVVRVLLSAALCQRLDRTGRLDDETSVLAVTADGAGPGAPPQLRAMLVNYRAAALLHRYQRARDPIDLDETVHLLEQALAYPTDEPTKAAVRNNLAVCLHEIYERTASEATLRRALDLTAESVTILQEARNRRLGVDLLITQACCTRVLLLASRWSRSGDPDDLDQALELIEAIEATTPSDSPALGPMFYTAASLMHDIALIQNDPDAAGQAVEWYAAALELAAPGSLFHAVTVTNYAVALGNRYDFTGSSDDLTRAIEFQRSLLGQFDSEEIQGLFEHNLSVMLLDRVMDEGRLEELDDVVGLAEASLARLPHGSVHTSLVMVRCAIAHYARHLFQERDGDRDRAFELLELAARLPESTLRRVDAARTLAELAADQSDWQICLIATVLALDGVEDVLGALDARQWDIWLRLIQGLAALGGYAAAMSGDSVQAIELIERGSGLMAAARLTEQRTSLDQARRNGHGAEVDAYLAALGRARALLPARGTAELNRLVAFPPRAESTSELSNAITDLIQARKRLYTRVPQVRPTADITELVSLVTESGHSMSYLAASPVGGIRLDIHPMPPGTVQPNITVSWMPDFHFDTAVDLALRLHAPEESPAIPPGDARPIRGASHAPDSNVVRSVVRELRERLGVGDLPEGDTPCRIVPVGVVGLLPVGPALERGDGMTRPIMVAASGLLHLAAHRNTATDDRTQDRIVAVVNPQPCHWDGQEWPSLDGSIEEGAMLAERFDARQLIGRAVSRVAVADLLRDPEVTVLHISAHGYTAEDDPDDVRLLLADSDDGIAETVTVDDLPEDLRLRLVFLGCCWLARGSTRLPDEAISFPSRMIQAGVAHVIAPLWPVDDNAAARLVRFFYEEFLAHSAVPAVALARARDALHRLAATSDRLGPRLRSELHATADAFVLVGG